MNDHPTFPFLSVVRPIKDAYEWKWRKENPERNTTGINEGDHLLYLGLIPNMGEHCAVARKDGVVVWALHSDSFELVPEEEL